MWQTFTLSKAKMDWKRPQIAKISHCMLHPWCLVLPKARIAHLYSNMSYLFTNPISYPVGYPGNESIDNGSPRLYLANVEYLISLVLAGPSRVLGIPQESGDFLFLLFWRLFSQTFWGFGVWGMWYETRRL